ncbi:hypothetical protein LXL04_012002 [Taraxacum kok-saghyz]
MQKASTQQEEKDQMAIQENQTHQSKTPQPCKTGCGFFGNPKTRDLCSVCFNFELKNEASTSSILDVNVAVKNPSEDHHSVNMKTRNRCWVCNKRVGLIGFGCRCGRIFCGLHRMPEEHSCDFDFKAAGRAVLQEQNPVCVADKLESRI